LGTLAPFNLTVPRKRHGNSVVDGTIGVVVGVAVVTGVAVGVGVGVGVGTGVAVAVATGVAVGGDVGTIASSSPPQAGTNNMISRLRATRSGKTYFLDMCISLLILRAHLVLPGGFSWINLTDKFIASSICCQHGMQDRQRMSGFSTSEHLYFLSNQALGSTVGEGQQPDACWSLTKVTL